MSKKKLCAICTIEVTMDSFILPAMEFFVDQGYDVTLVCNMSEDFIKRHSEKFHCVCIPMKRGIVISDLVRVPYQFWKLFRKEKFDYVQYATTNASFYAALPAKWCGVATRVYCQWGLLYIGYKGIKRTVFKWVERFLCRTATHITVASKKNLEYAVSEGLFQKPKASVVGDGGTVGVDFSVFNVARREEYKIDVQHQYPVLKGKTVFGYVGRIETDKGVGELLEAFLRLNNSEYALLLIGAFDELRSNLDPSIIQSAKDTGRVLFHGFTPEVPKYLSAMDVLVLPTYREGFSMVIQQAMAMGCAVITTDVPGPSEVIVDGESGLLVPAHSSDALVPVMDELGKDKEKRDRIVKNSLARVTELFGRQRMLRLTFEDRLRMMGDL